MQRAGSEVWLVLTSEAGEPRAEELARALLELRLAACISLIPVRSLYHWQGALEDSREVQLLIKTDRSHLAALHEAVLQRHGYATPLWLEWPAQSDQGYGAWLAAELVSPGAGSPAGADPPGDEDPAG
ncbi:MAG: divalent cation tolerance protein CutA [Synechococcaceae cyanobacterium]|nr:divalent cation tolerance protein CutA [Synechococcaceae cyanobacterium]